MLNLDTAAPLTKTVGNSLTRLVPPLQQSASASALKLMENERRHPKPVHLSYMNQTPSTFGSKLKLSNKASPLLTNDITDGAQKIGVTEYLSQSNRLDSTERKGGSYNIGGGVLDQAKTKKDDSY